MPAWVVPVVAGVLLVVVIAACVLLVVRRRKARVVSQVNELNEERDLQNRKTNEQENGKDVEYVNEAPCAKAEDTSNEHGQE